MPVVLGEQAQERVAANDSRESSRGLTAGSHRLVEIANGREKIDVAQGREPILDPDRQTGEVGSDLACRSAQAA